MLNLRLRLATVLIAIAATCCVAPMAPAAFTITMSQVGPNVVANGAGSLNLTGTADIGNDSNHALVAPSSPTVISGPSSNTNAEDFFVTMSGPASFGVGVTSVAATSGSGDLVGMFSRIILLVPRTYVSGNPLSDTATWSNKTYADLGVDPGVYTWTWGAGATADSYTLNIVSLPEPCALGLLSLAALGLRRRRTIR